MVVSMPLNTWLGKQTAAYTRKTMAARDKRVKYTNELLQGTAQSRTGCSTPSAVSAG